LCKGYKKLDARLQNLYLWNSLGYEIRNFLEKRGLIMSLPNGLDQESIVNSPNLAILVKENYCLEASGTGVLGFGKQAGTSIFSGYQVLGFGVMGTGFHTRSLVSSK